MSLQQQCEAGEILQQEEQEDHQEQQLEQQLAEQEPEPEQHAEGEDKQKSQSPGFSNCKGNSCGADAGN